MVWLLRKNMANRGLLTERTGPMLEMFGMGNNCPMSPMPYLLSFVWPLQFSTKGPLICLPRGLEDDRWIRLKQHRSHSGRYFSMRVRSVVGELGLSMLGVFLNLTPRGIPLSVCLSQNKVMLEAVLG